MSSVVDSIVRRSGWKSLPFGRITDRSKAANRPDLQPLSVFLDEGVVPRSSREDNHNQLGTDLTKYLRVQPGDIVFNKLRTWQGGFGVSSFEGVVSPAYFVCRPCGEVESRYLHYVLHSTPYLAELTRVSKFMPPSQFDILWDDLKQVPIPLPPLTTQCAIADYLDTETARIDALIEKKRRMAEVLDERRMSVITAGVSGQLTSEDVIASSLPWVATVGTRWRTVRLSLVAHLGTGHTPSRSHPEWWLDCSIPWITTGEVAQMRSDRIEFISDTREKISSLGIANSSAEIHPAGTVVLCRTASAGYSAIMKIDMATSQDFATWTCGPLLRPRFLLLCLRAMRQDLLGRLAMGSTHKTIYMPDIESLRIPLPDVAVQDGIIEYVSSLLGRTDHVVDQLHCQIELLVEHRQALITAAVTGDLPIPGATAA